MGKRFISSILVLLIVFTMLPLGTVTVHAEEKTRVISGSTTINDETITGTYKNSAILINGPHNVTFNNCIFKDINATSCLEVDFYSNAIDSIDNKPVADIDDPVIVIPTEYNITFNNCQFINCFSNDKGGILVNNCETIEAHFVFNNCEIDNCRAKNGGVIYVNNPNASISFLNTRITNCQASNCGGAIYVNNANSIRFYKSFARDCKANYGGFLYVNNSNLTITGENNITSSINNCSAKYYGGAICLWKGTPSLIGLVFDGNKAEYGGGIYSNAANVNTSNCIFLNNTANKAGGGVYLYKTDTTTKFNDSTFIYNESLEDTIGDLYASKNLPTIANINIYNDSNYDTKLGFNSKALKSIKLTKGDGSKNDPYRIENSEDILKLYYEVLYSKSYENNEVFKDKFIRLDNDVIVTKPIGVKDDLIIRPFSGTFNGNGRTIFVYCSDYHNTNVGAFGFTKNATVYNLNAAGYIKGGENVGGVIGYAESSKVNNCRNNATIINSHNAGGIIGSAESSEVTNCVNNVSISINNSNAGDDYIGGIIGRAKSSKTSECTNNGAITGNKNYIGGIVGCAESSEVTNCVNKASISFNSSDIGDGYAGGIIGRAKSSKTSECTNNGAITGNKNYIGGIIGGSDNAMTFYHCTNNGNIEGNNNVGGIVGLTSGNMNFCANYGEVKGNNNVGGIIGGYTNSSNLTNSINCKDISGDNYVGGLIGYEGDSEDDIINVQNCIIVGKITANKGNVGAVSGKVKETSSYVDCVCEPDCCINTLPATIEKNRNKIIDFFSDNLQDVKLEIGIDNETNLPIFGNDFFIDENGEYKIAIRPRHVTRDTDELVNATYVAEGSFEIPRRIEVVGNVLLILKANSNIRIKGGIHLAPGNTLTIASSTLGDHMGKLTAFITTGGDAAIGGSIKEDIIGEGCGNLIILGGNICAESYKKLFSGAAIGGAGRYPTYENNTSGGGGSGGNITIYNGILTARAQGDAAAIGGAYGFNTHKEGMYHGGSGGSLTIYGGKIDAKSDLIAIGPGSDDWSYAGNPCKITFGDGDFLYRSNLTGTSIVNKNDFNVDEFLEVVINAHPKHDYEVEYIWNSDYTECIAKEVCKKCPNYLKGHFGKEEKVITSKEKISEYTCATNEYTKYTAHFKDFADTSKTVITKPASGHDCTYEITNKNNEYKIHEKCKNCEHEKTYVFNDSNFLKQDYINVSNHAAINTQYKPTENTHVTMDVNVNGPMEYWFGVWDKNYNRKAFCLGNDGGGVYAGYGNQGGTDNFGAISNGRHTVELNKNIVLIDGNVRREFTYSYDDSNGFPINNTLYLFGQNRNGFIYIPNNSDNQIVTCYGAQIYELGALVRYFIPVIKNDTKEAGLYDLVESKFYGDSLKNGGSIEGQDFSIKFDSNEGSTPNPSSILATIGSLYGSLPTVTRTGYYFDGWYTSIEGGELITEDSIVKNGYKTLYAHWIPEQKITVSFDSNEGSTPEPSSIQAVISLKYGPLPTVTRTGYNFDGWYTEKYGGTKISENTIVDITENITLYAHWKAKNITIFFNANEGKRLVSPYVEKIVDLPYGELPTTTRPGYEFIGWYTSRDGGTKITPETIVQNNTKGVWAHWQRKDFIISFDSNGGRVDTTSKVVNYSSLYGYLPTPVKEGYFFDGWYTEKDGGTKISETTPVEITENTTLYAHWNTTLDINVEFNSNGGTNLEFETKIVTYGSPYGDLPKVVQSGFSFMGWYTTNNELITPSSIVNSTEKIILHAEWKEDPNLITLSSYGEGSIDYEPKDYKANDTITLIVNPSSGYKFIGFEVINPDPESATPLYISDDNKFTMPSSGGVAIAAIFKPYTIETITNGNGGVSFSRENDNTVNLETIPNKGYKFNSWNVIKPTNLEIIDDSFTMPEADVKIEALFKQNESHNITIQKTEHGTATSSISSSLEGEEVNLTVTPDEGYLFKEWKINNPTNLDIVNNSFAMPDEDVDIEAIFIEIPTYSINVINEGEGKGYAYPETAKQGETITLSYEPNEGYVFWTFEVPDTIELTNNTFIMPDGNVEIKAIFKQMPDTPDMPLMHSVSDTSVSIYNVIGQEYSNNEGLSWISSEEDTISFNDYLPNSLYRIITRVKASDTNIESNISEALTGNTKMNALIAPTSINVEKVTSTSIKVTYDSNVEYSILKGDEIIIDYSQGEDTNIFEGLEPQTLYTIKARFYETDDKMASKEVTINQYTGSVSPVISDTGYIDYKNEVYVLNTGYEISNNGITFTSPQTRDITPGETYYIRKVASGDIPASDIISIDVPRREALPSGLGQLEVFDYSNNIVTLEEYEGLEYSKNNGTSWQNSNVFEISKDNEYDFVVRIKATDSSFSGERSNKVHFDPDSNLRKVTLSSNNSELSHTSIYVEDGTTYSIDGNSITFGTGANAITVNALLEPNHMFDSWSCSNSGTISEDTNIEFSSSKIVASLLKEGESDLLFYDDIVEALIVAAKSDEVYIMDDLELDDDISIESLLDGIYGLLIKSELGGIDSIDLNGNEIILNSNGKLNIPAGIGFDINIINPSSDDKAIEPIYNAHNNTYTYVLVDKQEYENEPLIIYDDIGDLEFVTSGIYQDDSDVIVKVDENTLKVNDDYILEHGSTHVTLLNSYIRTLSVGRHTIIIGVKGYNTISQSFIIVRSNLPKYEVPNTGTN